MARTIDNLPPSWDATRLARVLQEHLSDFRVRYGLDSLELFGSYVHNQQRPDSDLDVLVSFSQAPTFFELVRLRDELVGLLGVSVDLVLRSTLRPGLARSIMQDLVRL